MRAKVSKSSRSESNRLYNWLIWLSLAFSKWRLQKVESWTAIQYISQLNLFTFKCTNYCTFFISLSKNFCPYLQKSNLKYVSPIKTPIKRIKWKTVCSQTKESTFPFETIETSLSTTVGTADISSLNLKCSCILLPRTFKRALTSFLLDKLQTKIL